MTNLLSQSCENPAVQCILSSRISPSAMRLKQGFRGSEIEDARTRNRLGIDKVATLSIPPEIDKVATLSISRGIDKVANLSNLAGD